jgi:hypothetical protein
MLDSEASGYKGSPNQSINIFLDLKAGQATNFPCAYASFDSAMILPYFSHLIVSNMEYSIDCTYKLVCPH